MLKIITDCTRVFCVTAASLVLLAGCTEDRYPDDAMVKQDFLILAPQRVPSDVEISLIDTYRSDGDEQSFSQVFVFDVYSSRRISIEDGWLKGSLLVPGDVVGHRKVEFIYQKKSGQWSVTADGPISAQ